MTDLPLIAASTQELLDLVAHHVGTVSGLMTPELAATLMRMNLGNRRMNSRGVGRYKTLAAAGKWINTGEPVIVSKEGLLNDGQHRLQAVIEGGVSVPMDVRFGVPREVFQQMGSGARRTAAQTLQALGQTFGPTQAAIAKLIYLHDNDLFAVKRPSVETLDVVRVVREDPRIAVIAKAIQGSKFTPVRTAGFGFPLVLAARVMPMERVLSFVSQVATGLTDSPRNGTRVLHERLLAALMKKERLDQLEVASITAQAWNAWIAGKEIRQLRILPTDKSGQSFPKIIGPPEAAQ